MKVTRIDILFSAIMVSLAVVFIVCSVALTVQLRTAAKDVRVNGLKSVITRLWEGTGE